MKQFMNVACKFQKDYTYTLTNANAALENDFFLLVTKN